MTSILLISLAIALVLYVVLAKTWGDDPKKAKKQEKGEIIRRLLALSELENSISPTAPLQGKLHGSRRGFVSTSRKP
jgi:hypothetical protein